MNIKNPRYMTIFLMYQRYILLKDILTECVMKLAKNFLLSYTYACFA